MPLSPALSRWLAAQGHDAVHASAAGLERAPDAEILAHATRDARMQQILDNLGENDLMRSIVVVERGRVRRRRLPI